MTTDAYIGLGGNVGPVARRFDEAIARIAAWPFVTAVRVSPWYRSAPVGPIADQPPFLNAVAEVTVEGVTPAALLSRLAGLESALGREAGEAQGPRAIDLDLLLFGAERIEEPSLTVPHPRSAQRAFVLRPLADLVGEEFSGLGRPLRELLAQPEVAAQDISVWAG